MTKKTERSKASSRTVRQSDLTLLIDVQATLQQEKHYVPFLMVIFLLVPVMTFVIWIQNSPLDEVIRGQGSTTPGSKERVIQTLDPGILKTPKVREGGTVEEGQILLTLDDIRSSAMLRKGGTRMNNLEAARVGLRVEAYSESLTSPDDVSAGLREGESATYRLRKTRLAQGVADLKQSKALLDKKIAMTRLVVREGAMSEAELLCMQRQSVELQLQMNEKQSKYLTGVGAELVKTEAELAQAKKNVAGEADPVERSCIRVLLRGIAKNIRVDTLGGVASAGQDIMEVIPLEDQSLTETYISPRGTAYARTGMPALVKLMAYDYAIYGGLDGVVTLVSLDTLRDQRRPGDLELNPNGAYYRVLATTSNNYLMGRNGKILPIIPGMVAGVDIKAGQKSVFQYLIKSVTRMKQAPRER